MKRTSNRCLLRRSNFYVDYWRSLISLRGQATDINNDDSTTLYRKIF